LTSSTGASPLLFAGSSSSPSASSSLEAAHTVDKSDIRKLLFRPFANGFVAVLCKPGTNFPPAAAATGVDVWPCDGSRGLGRDPGDDPMDGIRRKWDGEATGRAGAMYMSGTAATGDLARRDGDDEDEEPFLLVDGLNLQKFNIRDLQPISPVRKTQRRIFSTYITKSKALNCLVEKTHGRDISWTRKKTGRWKNL
jgi:hypothetical protein